MKVANLKRGDKYIYKITDGRSLVVEYKYNGLNGRVFEGAEGRHCLSDNAVELRVEEVE